MRRLRCHAMLIVAAIAVCAGVQASSGVVDVPAAELLPRAAASEGLLYLVTPPEGILYRSDRRETEELLAFVPNCRKDTVSVVLPVARDGWYRVVGLHLFGAWREGRHGWYKLRADGVTLPGQFHGWYGARPPGHYPKARGYIRGVEWGVVYLRAPTVTLTFYQPGGVGMLMTDRLGLEPVEEAELKEEEKKLRVAAGPPEAPSGWPVCAIDGTESVEWVTPVFRRAGGITVDGDLRDWDLSAPTIIINEQTMKKRGWCSPPPEGDRDLSVVGQLLWDDERLYLAARVTDDERAQTPGGQQWGSPWSYDGFAFFVNVPRWIQESSRGSAEGSNEVMFGLNYHSDGVPPRELAGGSRYVAKAVEGGYVIEAALTFESLGFSPRAGDRGRLFIIAVDHDPSKGKSTWSAPAFGQYGWNTRGGDVRGRGELRLLSPAGWGGELVPETAVCGIGDKLRYVGTLDSFRPGLTLKAVEVFRVDTGSAVHAAPVGRSLQQGRRYRLRGELQLPPLAPGRYGLRLVVE